MTAYRLYGLVVDADVDLHHPTTAAPDAPADVVIRRRDVRPVPTEEPEGPRVGRLEVDGELLRTLVRTADGYLFRFYGVCDFTVSADLTDVRYDLDPAVDPDLVGVLVGGTLLSILLLLRGDLVLHASGVDLGGTALGFVGSPGMGKSTLATLTALHGGALISDDVLRVDLSTPPAVWSGPTETRLRPGAAALADDADAARVRTTADGRTALRAPRTTTLDRLPLGAVVVPQPVRRDGKVEVTPQSPVEALLLLSQHPRVAGWSDRESRRRQFDLLGRLVEAVPVFRAELPWATFPKPELAASLLEAIGWDLSGPIPHRTDDPTNLENP